MEPHPASAIRPSAPRLAQVHAALGAFPLAAYLLLHVGETWPALAGRAAFSARFAATTSRPWLVAKTVLVLVPLVFHAVLGFARWGRRLRGAADPAGPASGYATPGLRTLQGVTGLLAAAYLVLHVAELTTPLWRGGASAQLYETLSLRAGTPFAISFAAIGLAAVCLHAGQGVPAALVTLGLVRRDGPLSFARAMSGLLAFVVWLALLDVTSHFAVGRALFGERTPSQVVGDTGIED
jgi:succinate dehydrogenase/fumarate reductase cytochrome b subunit